MCEPEFRETGQLAFEVLPPTHVRMLGVPYEELDLISYYALNLITLEAPN